MINIREIDYDELKEEIKRQVKGLKEVNFWRPESSADTINLDCKNKDGKDLHFGVIMGGDLLDNKSWSEVRPLVVKEFVMRLSEIG